MGARIKEATLVLATAFGLIGMVLGLAFVLQPETVAEVADSMLEPATKTVASNATPAIASQAKAGASLFGRNCAHCHGDDAKGDEGPSLYDLCLPSGSDVVAGSRTMPSEHSLELQTGTMRHLQNQAAGGNRLHGC